MNLTIDEKNSYTQCTRNDTVNYLPGLNIKEEDITNMLKEYEEGGGIENIWCLVLCLRTNWKSQGIMEGVNK